jgi:hypothetical protein
VCIAGQAGKAGAGCLDTPVPGPAAAPAHPGTAHTPYQLATIPEGG